MKHFLFIALGLFLGLSTNAQEMSIDELKKARDAKQAEIASIQAEVDNLQNKIDNIPGWRTGALGILGFNLNGNSDWVRIDDPDSRANSYGFNFIGYANKIEEKYFWNNTLTFNIKRTNTKENADATNVEATTDALDLASLYGYKLSDKWAVSAEGKYTSTLLNFNDPGKLLASAGVTWTPISNLVVNIHPLGYERNWPGELVSNAGAKIGATYANTTLLPGIAWTSTLNAFVPYQGGEADFAGDGMNIVNYDQSDLINWTWVNGFSFTAFKGIGVGFNVGLSQDRQQADLWRFNNPENVQLVQDENPLQVYYTLGLSYTL